MNKKIWVTLFFSFFVVFVGVGITLIILSLNMTTCQDWSSRHNDWMCGKSIDISTYTNQCNKHKCYCLKGQTSYSDTNSYVCLLNTPEGTSPALLISGIILLVIGIIVSVYILCKNLQ